MSETRKPRLRWFQYSLRSLLLLMLLVSLGMSWFAVRMQRARQQKAAVEEIRNLGGDVQYDYEVQQSGTPLPNAGPHGPVWLRDLLGEDFFASVVDVSLPCSSVTDAGMENLRGFTNLQTLTLGRKNVTGAGWEHLKGLTQLRTLDLPYGEVTDAGLEHLKGLTQLQELDLGATPVTDAGLVHLKGLTKLQLLDITHTHVTDGGVKTLQQALPKCKIETGH
jgi:hypothetical protein